METMRDPEKPRAISPHAQDRSKGNKTRTPTQLIKQVTNQARKTRPIISIGVQVLVAGRDVNRTQQEINQTSAYNYDLLSDS